jgi:hypothetical protein
MHHLFNVLNHLQPIRRWAREHQVTVALDASTFRLRLQREGRSLSFTPKFMIKPAPDQVAYTSEFTGRCRFCGWLPYQLKHWQIASEKIAFKEYCLATGLRVPADWSAGVPDGASFIVKPKKGSWGKGIRGPFHAGDLAQQKVVLPPDAFLDQFIEGRPTKIWYWNDTPVAIETITPPALIADGQRSLAEIAAQARGSFDVSHDLHDCEEVLAWQGFTPQSVPPANTRVLLSFLYASAFDRTEVLDRDSLGEQSEAFKEELHRIGHTLVQAIPEDIRKQTLFTVDGVIDSDGQLWLLEMNCHPVVHPNTYAALLPDCAAFLTGEQST